MPIIRKVITVGKAKAVTLPQGWLKYLVETFGEEPREVLVEMNGELRIRPHVQKMGGSADGCGDSADKN